MHNCVFFTFVGQNPDKKWTRQKKEKKKKGLKSYKIVKWGTKVHKCESWRTWSAIYKGHKWKESQNSKAKLYEIKDGGPSVQIWEGLELQIIFWLEQCYATAWERQRRENLFSTLLCGSIGLNYAAA